MGAAPITKEHQKRLIEAAERKAESNISHYEYEIQRCERSVENFKRRIASNKSLGYDYDVQERSMENYKNEIKGYKEDIKRTKEKLKKEIEQIKSRPIKK